MYLYQDKNEYSTCNYNGRGTRETNEFRFTQGFTSD